MPFDPAPFVKDLVASVKKAIGAAVEPLAAQITALEHRATRSGEHIARLETRLAALERQAKK